MKKKIQSLTPAQEKAMARYREEGIRIGFATGADMDEKLVRELTDKHRELHGVPKALNFTVYDSPFAALRVNSNLTPSNALYGQHDINWLIFYAFFRIECGLIEETNGIVHLLELTKHCNWMWMSTTDTIVTRRPVELHMVPKANGISVLHNTNDMAVKYKDGEGVFALNGVRIPYNLSHFITQKDKVKAADVMKITNTEIRSEVIKMMGPEFMFSNLPSKVLERASVENGGEYDLMEIMIDEQRRVYLSGVCPSKGDRFYEAVHPDCSTVRQALSFREWGSVEMEYLPPVIRT